MNSLTVLNKNGQLLVDSREVAGMVGKKHPHLLRDIDVYKNVLDQNPNLDSANFFIDSNYKGENKQSYACYLLTKKGCDMVANKMTGEKGILFTATYVTKFEEMEQSLKSVQPQISVELQSIIMLDQRTTETNKRIDTLETNMPLFNVECKELQALVRRVGIKALGGYRTSAYNDNSLRTKVYKDIQQQLKREFGIERYEGIKRSQLNTAKKIVTDYKIPLFLHDEINLMNEQCSFLQSAR